MDFLLMRANIFFVPFFIALLTSSCVTAPALPPTTPPASVPPQSSAQQQHMASLINIKSFSLKGRIGVVTQKQGFSGGIQWQHTPSTDNIDVFSPLGSKVANILKNRDGVTLTNQNGHTITAQDAESLTETTLGFKLPLTGLSDWALGKPTDSKIEASSLDDKGRLLSLKQDGWNISYENYAAQNGIDLPSKIILKSDKVNLKIVIEQWVSQP